MENEIENQRDGMLMVSIPRGEYWFQLQFSATAYFEKIDGNLVMETFESEVKNIRARLNRIYKKE